MNTTWAELPDGAKVGLGILVVLQLGLMIAAIVVLLRTPSDRLVMKSRWPWLAIIVLANVIGPIIFLAAGRTPARASEPSPTAPQPSDLQTLYAAPLAATDVPAVQVTDLVKTYGQTRALDGLDLTVPQGSVFGFLGPNGSGKTTTIRILLGLARATSGTALVLGEDLSHAPTMARKRVGFVPDVPTAYGWMTAPEFLQLVGELHQVPADVLDTRIPELLRLAGLDGVRTRIGGYSRGMAQRLGIAQALVNAPDVLILDEPTSALDPLGRRDVLDLIARLRGRTTVLFSTHILNDVERVCDQVAIINSGRVVVTGAVDEVKSRYGGGGRVLVSVDGDVTALQDRLVALPWVTQTHVVERDGLPALLVSATDVSPARHDIPRLVTELGLGLVRLEPIETSLEDVFVELVGKVS